MDYTVELTGDGEMEGEFGEVVQNADLDAGDTITYRQSIVDSKRLIDGEEVSPNEMVKAIAEAFEEYDNENLDVGVSHVSIRIQKKN